MFHADDRIESFWLWFDLNERQNVLNIFKPGQPRGTTTGIAFTRFLLSLAWCNAVGLRSRRARMMSSLRHHDRRFWPPGPFALCHKYYVRDDDARGADVVRDRGKYYQLRPEDSPSPDACRNVS